jgi:hypothetical protein
MMYDSPSPEWYEPEDDSHYDDYHYCKGVWCTDSSHQEEE